MLCLKLKVLVIVLLGFMAVSSAALRVIYYKNVSEKTDSVVHTVRPNFHEHQVTGRGFAYTNFISGF
jgi:hypothetical protein